jgi:hypothetical protein
MRAGAAERFDGGGAAAPLLDKHRFVALRLPHLWQNRVGGSFVPQVQTSGTPPVCHVMLRLAMPPLRFHPITIADMGAAERIADCAADSV